MYLFWIRLRQAFDQFALPLTLNPEHDPRCIAEIEAAFQRGRERGLRGVPELVSAVTYVRDNLGKRPVPVVRGPLDKNEVRFAGYDGLRAYAELDGALSAYALKGNKPSP